MERLTQLLRYLGILLALFLGVAFLWLVWPTRYRYDRLKGGTGEIPVRIDRLTGQAEGLSASGWVALRSSESTDSCREEGLPPFELARLDGQCSIDENLPNCDIYNGSNWTVDEIAVAFTVRDRKEVELLSRNHELARRAL